MLPWTEQALQFQRDQQAGKFPPAARFLFMPGMAPPKGGPDAVLIIATNKLGVINEVTTPEDYLGAVVGNMQQRRARVSEMRERGNLRIISATVPLGEMFGYATQLRSLSQGRASYAMEFSHYEPAPKAITEAVMGKK